jgi:glucose/arabinose dehydrogenase
MRIPRLTLALLAACGGDSSSGGKDAAIVKMDAPPTDAPALVSCTPTSGTNIKVRKLGTVSGGAVLATSPPGDGRLFVIEQNGRIRIFENEQLRSEAYLDITNLADFAAGGEQGLLGLAFHPNFAYNGLFYIFYTTTNANVVARYHASPTNYNKADPTGEVLLSIPDFAGNHNGGMMEFGADGYLYIGTGDGGGGGDPCLNGQQLLRDGSKCPSDNTTPREPLLGKILRIDVNTTTGSKAYGIPADNPYASGGGEPEIFMRGVRNPWRWSFDRMTGDMYIGDVGQGDWEELDVLTPAQQKGANLGWSMYEGNGHVFNAPADATGVFMPQFERNHNAGWLSIIGGQVYRGSCFPDIVGNYYFTDWNANELMMGTFSSGTFTATQLTKPSGWPSAISSIHADARGELFVTNTSGEVFQIEAAP